MPPGSHYTSKYHPNNCEHPYKNVTDGYLHVMGPNDEKLFKADIRYCAYCGYVLESPDWFDRTRLGDHNSRYEQ